MSAVRREDAVPRCLVAPRRVFVREVVDDDDDDDADVDDDECKENIDIVAN